ncbi:response regulator transcription factor [Limnofasciculus baicalensis]|uniref:Response regulator transcription factor n=1 Tax=Limnofasciculus baicalensis BBK-W-15 TaxID=2699891 RepID=A0AAE3KQH7_9CYAN|nr:response regulator transcription factor [Limnofasciculus baicalensis]MCP2730708.1 response regulator transcription factor [Limnofasciculus baicalensis BBK-W-15]
MNYHILVVEDEVKLAQFIELELKYEGYQVTVANDGLTGLTSARESKPDLIILDWMLPGISGPEICRRLRTTGDKVPIILLTAKDEVSDRVAGLDAGADDYVVKPFSVDELLAIVRAHLPQMFHHISLYRCRREFYSGDRLIPLTVSEFDLLEYFFTHPRKVITREELSTAVYGCYYVDDRILNINLSLLRRKLEANGGKCLLQTIRGVGWMLREP